MKSFLLCLSIVFTIQSFGQETLTSSDWQDDLRVLQTTIHRDYSFLFKKVSATDFDAAVDALYTAIPNMEAHELPVAFSRIVSLFKYGHTQIPFYQVAQEGVLPVNLYHFNNGVYIEGVEKTHQKTLGAKVLKVEGIEVELALKKIRPVVPAENDSYFKAYGLRFLTVPAVLHAQGLLSEWSKNVTFTLEKDGKTFDYNFPTVPLQNLSSGAGMLTVPNDDWLSVRPQDKTPLYLKAINEKHYFFEYLQDSKTLYVRQSSVFDDPKESLKDFYERLFAFIDTNAIDKLIYDVRLNGGGDNSNNIQLIKGLMARPKINKKGHFFFIIGRHTFSAAQNLTNAIDTLTEAIMVGEPTAENVNFYGDSRPLVLPNSKLTAYLSFAWWQDKPQWNKSDATEPHIAVDMSFEQYVANEDPVLEAALNYEDDDFILDPIAHLTALFTAGDYEQLKSDANKIAKDPKYKFYDFETEFTKTGQNLLNSGNTEGALFVFEVVAEVHEESVSALYLLASTQEQAQLNDKAIASYKKILILQPKSMLANSVRNRIKALEDD